MGICSSQSQNNAIIRKDDNGNETLLANRPPPTNTIKIIAQDGTLLEFSRPIKAAQALNNLLITTGGRCFIYSAESMLVGEPPPRLSPEDQLEPGQIYFLLPMSQSQYPLSLQDCCLLAIRASVALGLSQPLNDSRARLPEKELSFAGERGGLVLCFQ